jgi:large subunit ribosomal protein L15
MPMNLSDLVPNEGSNRKRKRVGRGTGSGHGKTSGRGTKGQKSRSGPGVRAGFEGGQLPIQRRMPYKRGFTNIYKADWEVVNLGTLESHGFSGEVTPQTLYERGVIRGLEFPVKILANGELTKALSISAHAASASAMAQIEAAGGSFTLIERTDRWVTARPRSKRLVINSELKRAGFGKVGGPTKRQDRSER